MKNNVTPTALTERIHILDILRGFAIFGILAVNIGGFATAQFFPGYIMPAMPWYDTVAKNLMTFFAEGKFYSIFSFLFGLGFAMQLNRAQANGRDINSFYPRRLWVLFGFGILHALLFWLGDILRLYALLGFILLVFRNHTSRTLLVWAGIFLALSFFLLMLIGGPNGGNEPIPGIDLVSMAQKAYGSASYLNVLIFQSIIFLPSLIVIALIQGFSVMALFLLGTLTGRSHFFERLNENRDWLMRALIAGLVVGIPGNVLLTWAANPFWTSLGFTFGAPALALTYVAVISLVSLSQTGQKALVPLASVGRMALTNYVLQSVICSILFSGYGAGLYEKIGAAGLWGITFLIYLVQIPFSMWWLSKFQFGPLEWVWRSLTYRQWQHFRYANADVTN